MRIRRILPSAWVRWQTQDAGTAILSAEGDNEHAEPANEGEVLTDRAAASSGMRLAGAHPRWRGKHGARTSAEASAPPRSFREQDAHRIQLRG